MKKNVISLLTIVSILISIFQPLTLYAEEIPQDAYPVIYGTEYIGKEIVADITTETDETIYESEDTGADTEDNADIDPDIDNVREDESLSVTTASSSDGDYVEAVFDGGINDDTTAGADMSVMLNESNNYEEYISVQSVDDDEISLTASSYYTLHVWITDETVTGGLGRHVPSKVRLGDTTYLCYEVLNGLGPFNYDGTDTKHTTSSSYKAKETIYYPDSSVLYSYTYSNSNNNWIKVTWGTASATGLYKGNVTLSGGLSLSVDVSWYVYDTVPSIVSSPISRTVKSGNSSTFYVSASGTHLAYQWYYSTTASGSGTAISGANSSGYTVTASSANSGRYYYCGVSNYGNSTVYSSRAKLTTSYTIQYNANGGIGAPSEQTKTHGTALTLSSETPTRTGYTFLGWSTSSAATSATYKVGDSFTANANTTLYAVWSSAQCTLTYNANGGTGAPPVQTATAGGTVTLSSTIPARFGYKFLGWGSANSTSASYYPGRTYKINASVTLYAVWEEAAVINTSTSQTLSVDIDYGGTYVYFSFTPTVSGTYVFESSAAAETDTFVYLCSSNGTILAYDDDSGNGSNALKNAPQKKK